MNITGVFILKNASKLKFMIQEMMVLTTVFTNLFMMTLSWYILNSRAVAVESIYLEIVPQLDPPICRVIFPPSHHQFRTRLQLIALQIKIIWKSHCKLTPTQTRIIGQLIDGGLKQHSYGTVYLKSQTSKISKSIDMTIVLIHIDVSDSQ